MKLKIPYIFLFIVFMALLVKANAQETTYKGKRIYQLSGMIIDRKTGEPVSFAKIIVNNKTRFAIGNEEGFYSIPVIETDTLNFSRNGFKPSKLIISQYLKEYKGDTSKPYIYEIHYLDEDEAYTLPVVTIHQYRNAEDIKYAVKNMGNSQFDINARDNVSPEIIDYFMKNLPQDDQDRLQVAQKRFENYSLNKNTMGGTFFDPVAVYGLIKHMAKKAKEKKEKNMDYWPE